MKKKVFKIVLFVLLGYAIFASVVLFLFNAVRNNSTDQIAMPYIWESEEVFAEYGEVISVGRMVFKKIEKTETLMKVPYSVYVGDYRLIVYVNLSKSGEDWIPVSLEIEKVIEESFFDRDS